MMCQDISTYATLVSTSTASGHRASFSLISYPELAHCGTRTWLQNRHAKPCHRVVRPSATLHIPSTRCAWLPQFCANSQLAFQLIFKGLNHSELQQTYEQLIIQNAAFKSRVTELEVIKKL
jgi:hypothetical protein